MLAAATTATTTTAAASTASIAAPTANIRNNSNTNGNNNNNNNNMQTKKIVLYNPSVDYSAPLQQQINPDIIGAHPHAQHYQQQQCSGGSGSGGSGSAPGNTIHNTNQVRQPLQQQQQQTQQQPRLSAFAPVAAARLSLAGLAAAAAPTASAPTGGGMASSQQQQQQQQLQLQQQMLATLALPLKLSEQCNLSNLHLNSFANEMSPLKSGLEQQQQQQQHNNINNNQVVGLLGRNVGANGLLANNSVGSSISNLLISNNLTTTAATATAAAAAATTSTSAVGVGDGAMSLLPANSKLNALWGQPHAANAAYNHAVGNTGAGNLFNNPTNNSDAISTLWGCSSSSASSGASSTSGCSSGSGSQPSLSPTSITSTRPDYHSGVGNGKEPLWPLTQQTSPNSSNTLRDTYYTTTITTKAGVAIAAANVLDGGANNNADSVQQSTSPTSTCSSTSSSASSTCSSGVGSNAGLDIGTWPNCKLQNYFANDNCNANTADDVAHFAKINNIWDIPSATTNTSTRSADLFTDLWCNNTDGSAAAAGTRTNNNTIAEFDLGGGDTVDFSDASNIWRTNITATSSAGAAGRAQPKQLAATIAGNNNKAVRANLATDVDNGAAETDANGAACMQLFSEQFLNYINIMNYTD